MKKPLFYGTCTAAITPFKNGTADFESLDGFIEFQIKNAIPALCFLGTTGESAAVDSDEFKAILGFGVKKVNKRAVVIAGAGAATTASCVKKSIAAQKAGADGLLIVTPFYGGCTQQGLYNHYKAVSEAVEIPIICYNVPRRTGVNILPDTAGKIAELKNVYGFKEASGDVRQATETAFAIKGNAYLYSGDDALTLPLLAAGAIGSVSVVSNILPDKVNAVYNLFSEGKISEAAEISESIFPLIRLLFSEVNPIPVKAAAKLMGLCSGELRAPLTDLTDKNLSALKKELVKLGAIYD